MKASAGPTTERLDELSIRPESAADDWTYLLPLVPSPSPGGLIVYHMKTNETFTPGAKLVLRGINLKVTPAMEAMFTEKVGRLIRHEPRIIRIRVDLEDDSAGGTPRFVAKGHIEIAGPDLIASVTTEDAYKSVDGLVDRLDRMLRKRVAALTSRRHDGNIRDHVEALAG